MFAMTTGRERAIGALVGLAAGDAVGTTLEFRVPGTFEPISDLVGGGPFNLQAGQWTDDTSMAMCLAESILDTGVLDLADQLRRYVLWRDEGYWSSTGTCFDIGISTRAGLSRFVRDGSVTAAVVDEEAAANGSLMRLAPVPIRWWTDPAVAAERSGESSRTTHGASRPVDACRVYGAMIAALIGGASFEEVVDPGFWTFGPLHPEIEAIVRGSWRDKEPSEIRGSGFVVAALEAAIWAVAGAETFADAVLRAANLGDDADTTAAIAGQLAGARWGVDGIPRRWRELLVELDRIEEIAGRLFDAGAGVALTDIPDGPWCHDQFIHGYWVEPGRILAGEYPGSPNPKMSASKVNLLVDAGVRTFIDLTSSVDCLEEYESHVALAAKRRGLDLRVVHVPVPDMGVRPDDGYDEIIEAIRSATERGVVYVHCWGGIGRTATVVGCWLVDAGLSASEALGAIDERRSVTRKHFHAAPQTSEQRAVIERRAARRR